MRAGRPRADTKQDVLIMSAVKNPHPLSLIRNEISLCMRVVKIYFIDNNLEIYYFIVKDNLIIYWNLNGQL